MHSMNISLLSKRWNLYDVHARKILSADFEQLSDSIAMTKQMLALQLTRSRMTTREWAITSFAEATV